MKNDGVEYGVQSDLRGARHIFFVGDRKWIYVWFIVQKMSKIEK